MTIGTDESVEALVAAVKRVGKQFHRTRRTHEVHVDPDDLYLVLKAAGYYDDSIEARARTASSTREA